MPVDTVKALDSVEIVLPLATVEAVTRTAAATVPLLTTVLTSPVLSLVADIGVIVIPPTVVLSEKLTELPTLGPPAVLRTLKMTVEVAEPPALPTPFKVIEGGVAETNWIEPTAAVATVTVPVAVSVCDPTAAVAEMTSEPEQPLAV
jgi:hypothetical protein